MLKFCSACLLLDYNIRKMLIIVFNVYIYVVFKNLVLKRNEERE